MTLNQALAIVNARKGLGSLTVHRLVCGFEPMHLATLLRAHLLERIAGDVELQHGIYGDFLGNLKSAAESDAIAAAVVLEWSDIDPRLGLRSSGGWTQAMKPTIISDCLQRFAQIEAALKKLAAKMPVALNAPNLPLPPIGNTVSAQSDTFELELSQQLASFLVRASHVPGVRVVATPRINEAALDARMELLAGFPYTVAFASTLAAAIASVLWQKQPKKGLITDLDDTFWRGLVGEVGPEAISWSQEHHTQLHGLYQQMLGNLAGAGVLLAICSKNESATVEKALARKDLFCSSGSFFPIYANWGPKSASVARILEIWNIAADSVVFVDDNPMELEEVRQAFPGITGLPFNGKDANATWNLLSTLRDLFGKPVLTQEDQMRQASIRAAAEIRDMEGAESGSPEFLRTLQGAVTFTWHVEPADKRPVELINKTNQFNLNGMRIAEGDWQRRLEQPATLLTVVSYQDKFGPLGKIAALLGSKIGDTVDVSYWVMSCRSFSRRLEHHTLEALFERSGANEIRFDYQATERNQPLQEFFQTLGIAPGPDGSHRLSRAQFLERRGELPHQVCGLSK